jgi:hypothetical protein
MKKVKLTANVILNGCGGKKGTKCGVQEYHLPKDEKLAEISAKSN